MEAAAIPAEPPSPRLFAGVKARRAAKRAARLTSDADRFERAAARLEAVVGQEAWQVRHLYRQAEDLRRLASEEAAALAPAA
jgi:branched-subunit amino acid aminotransferase/4-amino-4-deoxychorismate lyase